MTLFVLLCMTITSVNAQVNLALDKPVYASSKQEEAKNAVDGKDNTRWQAAEEDENEWWYVDLGETFDLDFIEINWEVLLQRGLSCMELQMNRIKQPAKELGAC